MAPSPNVDVRQLKLALDKILKPVEHLFIDQERLTERTLIARGGFGSVSTARLRSHPTAPDFEIVAVKELILVGDDEQGIKITTSFARELRVWSKVDHPNVLPLQGFFLDTAAAVALFITPYEPHGNLHKYLEREKPDDHKRLDLAIDTASGLLYLHSQKTPICHGDIKSLNVLVTAEGRAKLCDFGLAKIVEEHPSGLTTAGFEEATTIMYISHELACVEGSRRSLRSDVWAWGGVSLEIFTGQLPYQRCKGGMQISIQLLQGALPAPLDSLAVSDRIRDLFRQCWEKDPSSRITMSVCHGILLEEKASINEAERSESQRLADARRRLDSYRLDTSMIELQDGSDVKATQGTVKRGTMRQSFRWAPSGTSVAVETILVRGERYDWSEELRRYARSLDIWINLNHPSVLPFLGFNLDQTTGQFQWISPWMANGRLNEYIQRTSPSQAERARLSLGVARGVLYLHSMNPALAHGDLRALNILVDSAGNTILSNFQLAKTENWVSEYTGLTTSVRSSFRWFSPELLTSMDAQAGPSDMWAWACLLVEIFLEQMPFRDKQSVSTVLRALIDGTLPSTLETLSSLPKELPRHIQRCWNQDPTQRPTIQDAIVVINGLLGNPPEPDPPVPESLSWSPAPDGILLPDATLAPAQVEPLVPQLPRRPTTPEIIRPEVPRERPLGLGAAQSSNVDGVGAQSGKKRGLLARVKRFFKSPRI